MNNRLVLILLLCSTVGNVVGCGKKDLTTKCGGIEYFRSFFNPKYYGKSKDEAIKEFLLALETDDIKTARTIICYNASKVFMQDSLYSIMGDFLDQALEEGKSDFVKLLVRNGAFLDDCCGMSWLEKLIDYENKHENPDDLARVFLENGANLSCFRFGKVESEYLNSKSKSKVVQFIKDKTKK